MTQDKRIELLCTMAATITAHPNAVGTAIAVERAYYILEEVLKMEAKQANEKFTAMAKE